MCMTNVRIIQGEVTALPSFNKLRKEIPLTLKAQETVLRVEEAVRQGILPKVPVYIDGMIRSGGRPLQRRLARAVALDEARVRTNADS